MSEWETAVVLVMDARGRVLLVHQAYGRRLFGLPGGVVDDGETPAAAATREAHEETGLLVTLGSPIGVYDLVYPGTGQRYRAHAFGCATVTGEPAVQDPTEITSVGWYPLDALPEPLTPSAAAVLASVRRSPQPDVP